MLLLLIICVLFGAVGGLVLLFVAFPYRRRTPPVAQRLTGGLAAVAEKIDPGEAPPQGVLTKPERARRAQRRIELVERRIALRLHAAGHAVTHKRPGGDRVHAGAGAARHR